MINLDIFQGELNGISQGFIRNINIFKICDLSPIVTLIM